MINISEIVSSQNKYQKVLSDLFQNQKKTKIKFIRLASHFNEISETVKICEFLKKEKEIQGHY